MNLKVDTHTKLIQKDKPAEKPLQPEICMIGNFTMERTNLAKQP